jgi:hypothetical protein
MREGSDGSALWRDLGDVQGDIYQPLLTAFAEELQRLTTSGSPTAHSAAAALVEYVVGRFDFYKVIGQRNQVTLQAFNFGGSLNGKKTRMPTVLVRIDSLSGGQASRTVYFDHGYTFNFRIHNASSRIEPSLKFDIQAVSLPPSLYTHNIPL